LFHPSRKPRRRGAKGWRQRSAVHAIPFPASRGAGERPWRARPLGPFAGSPLLAAACGPRLPRHRIAHPGPGGCWLLRRFSAQGR
jgi:hypothetical protein